MPPKGRSSAVPQQKVAAVMEPIDSLIPWEQNPRKNDQAVDAVVQSIQTFGFGAPLLVRTADRKIIAGHTRYKAAKRLGLTEVPVRWMDLTEAQAKALALADNRLGELAEWDEDLLSTVLRDIKGTAEELIGSIGWDNDELAKILAKGNTPPPNATNDPLPGPLPPDAGTHSKPGGIYALGPHVLVCGDSTDPATWALLDQVRGERPYDMVWTDPPYGVSFKSPGRTNEHEIIANDDLDAEELTAFLRKVFGLMYARTRAGGVWYVASPDGPLRHCFATALLELPTVWRQSFAWVKDTMVFGRSDRHYQHEAIFYGWKEGAAHTWTAGRKKTSVINCKRPRVSDLHPTMKPIELIEECISCHRPKRGDVLVMEPFGGSGSTLIASARQGYRCHAIELSPAYCDVIRDRWTRWAQEAGQDPGPDALLLQRSDT